MQKYLITITITDSSAYTGEYTNMSREDAIKLAYRDAQKNTARELTKNDNLYDIQISAKCPICEKVSWLGNHVAYCSSCDWQLVKKLIKEDECKNTPE